MKTCNVDGCNRPIFGKGVCVYHYPKTKLKVNPQVAKNFLSCLGKSEVVGPEKQKAAEEHVIKDSLKLEKRNQLFLSVWQTRKHVCEICGKHLGNESKSYMFDHLLEKSKYEFLEFEPLNIALVCLECHDKKTRGFINAIYQEKINFVITKFNVS